MTTSGLEHNQSLAYTGFRPKMIEKSMMIIEQNSSEYSSPKKMVTASGFLDNGMSQRDLLRPESCLGVGGERRIGIKNIECQNKAEFTPPKINKSIRMARPEINSFESSKRRITFNYMSPSQVINKKPAILSGP